jgi:hypothetical protein
MPSCKLHATGYAIKVRLHVANELWRLCAGIISPGEVTEIANSVENELGRHADRLALIHTIIARRGYTGSDVHRIAVLVSMVLIDRVNPELGSLKAERHDCRY